MALLTPPEEPGELRLGSPFFILGCVRSGTTMLRDVLRRHPNFACPEETHFLRWGEPFGTEGLGKQIIRNPVLREHRTLDGISEEEFSSLYWGSQSKADLYQRYMARFIKHNKPNAHRWFDKTPQNVYGALLVAAAIPDAKFVHIVRNPLNVAASLRIGKVMRIPWGVAAANYWLEAIQIIAGLKKAYPDRVHELKYESFAQDASAAIHDLMRFLDEPYESADFCDLPIREVDHLRDGGLSAKARDEVIRVCGNEMRRYGYL
jgi:hypothetical protein